MKQSSDKYYDEITELNEGAEFSLEIISNRAFIIVDNFLKRPDDFKELLYNHPHWDNYVTEDGFSRPGKSALLPNKCGNFMGKYLDQFFGLDKLTPFSVYTNCLNGNMQVAERCMYPHIDGKNNNCIASTIFLNENSLGGTAFWSLDNGLHQEPMISMHHLNSFDKKNLLRRTSNNILTSWKQHTHIDEWKMDCILPQKYNRFVAYSGRLFHNPYIEEDWYCDEDRFSFVTMLHAENANTLVDAYLPLQEQYEKLREIFYLTTPCF